MTINSSYTNLSNIGDTQSSSLQRLTSGQAINSASDNASGLAIVDKLNVQENSLSQSVSNMNSGIAMSNIAQSGISNQKDILENIRTEIVKSMNGTMNKEDRNIIENQISKYIDQYNNIASSTTYNGNTLLQTASDPSDDISITGEDTSIQMSKADTSSVSSGLSSLLADFSTNTDSRSSMLYLVDKGIDTLNSYASDFASASNAMESNARNSISMQTNMAEAQSVISDIDYSKEIGNFSKSNILSQIGIIVQSQANASLNRNIALLT
ncbi:MAG TPA: hypothetical protein EYG73_04310 [Arcobacter sp.]|nr:hypothetical protein [Arcobacter sp.]